MISIQCPALGLDLVVTDTKCLTRLSTGCQIATLALLTALFVTCDSDVSTTGGIKLNLMEN